jgi:hypothetical protein
MFIPVTREELLGAEKAVLALKLRHAHHTVDFPPTVLASAAARFRTALFKRNVRARPVPTGANLGRPVDAADRA